MPKKDASPKLNRRRFLTAAAVAGASGAVNPGKAATAAEPQQRLPSALPPNAHVAAAEAGVPDVPPYAGEGRPGSDFMVDVIKTLDIKYLGQSGIELSRHSRVADQLRQEHDAGVPHLHP